MKTVWTKKSDRIENSQYRAPLCRSSQKQASLFRLISAHASFGKRLVMK